jgi:hypothetical protein
VPPVRSPDQQIIQVLAERGIELTTSPKTLADDVVRAIRDDIQDRVTTLLGQILHS